MRVEHVIDYGQYDKGRITDTSSGTTTDVLVFKSPTIWWWSTLYEAEEGLGL